METIDIGRRIELVSMDKHCDDISVGLYHRDTDDGPQVLVHTYAGSSAATERIAFIRQALEVMVGMEAATEPGWFRFSCGQLHERPLRRAFLEVCKLPSDAELKPRVLRVFDKKAGCELTATGIGGGGYQIGASEQLDSAAKRIGALATGLVKVGEMEPAGTGGDQVAFSCGAAHDALLSLLLGRAQNVRASLREENESATRGVLAAPSQQK